jgi:hypothetical protein
MSLKSVLAGYLRGWLGGAAMFMGGVGVAATMGLYLGMDVAGLIAIFSGIGVWVALLWFVFNCRTWWFLPVQLAILVCSLAVYHDV